MGASHLVKMKRTLTDELPTEHFHFKVLSQQENLVQLLPFVDGARAVRVHPPALVLGDQRHLGRPQAVALLPVHWKR